MQHGEVLVTLEAGRYRLLEPIAESAYGIVWRARSEDGRGELALKLVNAQQMERALPALRQRWSANAANEIGFLRSLAPWDERHIVRLIDSGTHDGLPAMALELLDGDLSTRHDTPLQRVLAWIGQINQALAKVHQYGWRYLDLKPANVLLHRDGGVRLADFGTSRLLQDGPSAGYAGTASWQAPEQFFPDRDGAYHTDQRSDYFALGAMLYYLVTGRRQLRYCHECGQAYRAHLAGGAAALRARYGGAPPPTLREDEAALFAQRVAWSAPALALLRALLAPQRQQRPRNALEISRMIAAIAPCRSAA